MKEFGSFHNLNVIKIGPGAGTNAALMAKYGAKVSVLDYSEGALKRAKQFFQHNSVMVNFFQQDALSMPTKLLGKFDISMSFGLTEHFSGDARVEITKVHFDVLRKGGMTFISVPNKFNLPYRIWKLAAHLKKTWMVGEEYPYSRKELRDICRQLRVSEYSFVGDSLIGSIDFINPFQQINKLRNLLINEGNLDISKIKREKETPLDAYFAYALVLCSKK